MVIRLYETPTHKNGKQSLQFSFATKLYHMVDNHWPIYDSQIATFFFFRETKSPSDFMGKLQDLVEFHEFLVREYVEHLIKNHGFEGSPLRIAAIDLYLMMLELLEKARKLGVELFGQYDFPDDGEELAQKLRDHYISQ